MLFILLNTWLKIIIPAGIRMFFSRKNLNLVCVGTTTSFRPGRLQKTQYAWLLIVLCRGKIRGWALYDPLRVFSNRTLVRSWTNFYNIFSVCLKVSHLLRHFRHRTPPSVHLIRIFLWRILQAYWAPFFWLCAFVTKDALIILCTVTRHLRKDLKNLTKYFVILKLIWCIMKIIQRPKSILKYTIIYNQQSWTSFRTLSRLCISLSLSLSLSQPQQNSFVNTEIIFSVSWAFGDDHIIGCPTSQ